MVNTIYFLNRLRSFIKLSRIGVAWIPYPIGFMIGVALSSAWSFKIVPALFSIFSATAAGYAVNFVADVDVDKITTRKKDIDLRKNPIVVGEILEKEAYIFAIILIAISLGLAIYINYIFFTIAVLSIFFGIVCYSVLYWKSKPFLDILCIPLITFSLPFLAGYYLIGIHHFPLSVFLGGNALAMAAYLVTEQHDIEFDKEAGIKTTAVVLKEKTTLLVVFLQLFALLVLALL